MTLRAFHRYIVTGDGHERQTAATTQSAATPSGTRLLVMAMRPIGDLALLVVAELGIKLLVRKIAKSQHRIDLQRALAAVQCKASELRVDQIDLAEVDEHDDPAS